MPRPGPGQVLVEVKAAGVNPVETYMRTGKHALTPSLPWTPGHDGAGVISAVGENVTGLTVGKRVWITQTLTGSYAQFCLCPATAVRLLPFTVTYEQGAAISVPYRTAYRALFQKGQGRPGQTVLVHGGSGGTGIATIQLAAAAGLKVLATAGTDAGLELVRREGAQAAFNHRSPDYVAEILKATEGRGVDLIVEMLANVNLGTDLTMLARGGTVAIVGSRGTVEINPRELMSREASVVGVMAAGTDGSEAFAAIEAGLLSRTVRPIVAKTFPLAGVAAAHTEVIEHTSGTSGKIVLLPWA